MYPLQRIKITPKDCGHVNDKSAVSAKILSLCLVDWTERNKVVNLKKKLLYSLTLKRRALIYIILMCMCMSINQSVWFIINSVQMVLILVYSRQGRKLLLIYIFWWVNCMFRVLSFMEIDCSSLPIYILVKRIFIPWIDIVQACLATFNNWSS